MILGRVHNGVAVWRCSECGSEQPIIKYIYVNGYGKHIDMEAIIQERDGFIAKHTLCKKEVVQTELFI